MIDWNDGTWHIAYLIGVPVLSLVVLGLFTTAAVGLYFWRDSRWDSLSGGAIAAVVGSVLGLVAVAALAGILWPLDSTFHKYYPVTGTVEQVSSRIIPDGKGMAQRFVVVLDGKPFAIDDTRASLIKVGDAVALQCSREYQYAGASGWSCEWGQEVGR